MPVLVSPPTKGGAVVTTPSLVVAVDLPAPREDLGPVVELAKVTGWPIHLLHAAAPEPAFVGFDPPGGVYDEYGRNKELADEYEELNEQAEILSARGVDARAHVIVGPTLETIIKTAKTWDAQMIVVVGHKHHLAHRLVLGSVASALVKTSPIPVLVLPAEGIESRDLGLDTAVDRLVEIIDREDRTPELEPLRIAAEHQMRTSSEGSAESDEKKRVGARLKQALHEFETDHPSLTQAINDVAYYLSAMGI